MVCALVVAGLSGCEQEPPEGPPPGDADRGVSTVRVHAGSPARVSSSDGAVAVELPASSFTGDGTLSVAAATGPGGVAGWDIDLVGAQLTGPAEIRFIGTDLAAGEPAPRVAYATSGAGKLSEVPPGEVRLVEGDAVVVTDHFSFWLVDWWSGVVEALRDVMDFLYSAEAVGAQPDCGGRDQEVYGAGFTVTTDKGSRVKWCVRMGSDARPRLSLVNARGYWVAVEASTGVRFEPSGPKDVLASFADLVKDAPGKRGDTVELVGPGQRLDVVVGTDALAGVLVRPSAASFLVSAAQFAVDTVLLLATRSGASVSRAAVVSALELESCLAGFTSMVSADVGNPTQAARYLNEALGAALGCAGPALGRLGMQVPLASVWTWFMTGVQTALSGFGAAADSALDYDGYQVLFRRGPASLPAVDVSGYGIADFTSPSGRIRCSMDQVSFGMPEAACGLVEGMDLSSLPPDDVLWCGGDYGIAGVRVVEGAGWACAGGILATPGLDGSTTGWFAGTGFPPGPVGSYGLGAAVPSAALPYGRSLVMGDIRCTSLKTGVRCENTETGGGFQISLAGPGFFGPGADEVNIPRP